MLKIVTVIGARPQFIKAAAVTRALSEKTGVQEILLHTGQHFDPNMSDVFFSELEIPKPDYNLDIHGGNHGEQTGRMLSSIEPVLLNEKPDLVLVYGDTNSTLAGALAAKKLHIKVAHVEAGLRSFNMKMPEEINRVLTDRISDILFCPTDTAVENLRREGFVISPESTADASTQRAFTLPVVMNVGDVMYDVAIFAGEKAEQQSLILQECDVVHKDYILATVHRAENTDDLTRLLSIMNGLSRIARDVSVVLPLHPRTRKKLDAIGWRPSNDARLQIIEPVGYLDMVMLEKHASLIATDSGGVQKEAYFHNVPCVTLRDETEWVELVETGWNVLCEPASQVAVAERILGKLVEPKPESRPLFYGEGNAAGHISNALCSVLEG